MKYIDCSTFSKILKFCYNSSLIKKKYFSTSTEQRKIYEKPNYNFIRFFLNHNELLYLYDKKYNVNMLFKN